MVTGQLYREHAVLYFYKCRFFCWPGGMKVAYKARHCLCGASQDAPGAGYYNKTRHKSLFELNGVRAMRNVRNVLVLRPTQALSSAQARQVVLVVSAPLQHQKDALGTACQNGFRFAQQPVRRAGCVYAIGSCISASCASCCMTCGV